MAGKQYIHGLWLALFWLALLLVALYATARYVQGAQYTQMLILLLLVAWPLAAGLLSGWQAGKRDKSGFAAGLRYVSAPLLLLAALWWWLLPQLWQAGLYGKFALYVVAAALFSGGLGAGLARARLLLYPQQQDEAEDDIPGEDEKKE